MLILSTRTVRLFAVFSLFAAILAETPRLLSQASTDHSPQSIAGNYEGMIGPKQANLRFRTNSDGTLRGSLDHLGPDAPWMFVLADIQFDARTLRFKVPFVNASFEGERTADGSGVVGTWSQSKNTLPAAFTMVKFDAAPHPSALDGIWLELQPGSRTAQGGSEPGRNQMVFRSDTAGREFCTLDQLDIYTMDEECSTVNVNGNDVRFTVPAAGVAWNGKLSADGNELVGTWVAKIESGQTLKDYTTSSDFHRQKALSAEKERPRVEYDAAIAPVAAADLEGVLNKDIAEALKGNDLAPATGGGVTIAVYAHGVRRIFCYGAARVDSIYEIGSMTKTFTGLLLAQMAEQGKVKLDEPVRELLPAGTVAKPEGQEITLLDLATQRSGLPAMPDNIGLENLAQPYADYHSADLMAYMGKHGVANPTQASSPFGSLGFGLLGVALATRAGTSYDELVRAQIAGPLEMRDTAMNLTPEQRARMIAGHDQFHGVSDAWKVDALGGAIGLRSTAGDLLAFLEATLHPEALHPDGSFPASTTLANALRQSVAPHGEVTGSMHIALGWLYQSETGNYWHNGATASNSMYAFFNPKGDYAAVVLYNTSPGVHGSFAEVLGRHISQRLAGRPAISLTHY